MFKTIVHFILVQESPAHTNTPTDINTHRLTYEASTAQQNQQIVFVVTQSFAKHVKMFYTFIQADNVWLFSWYIQDFL